MCFLDVFLAWNLENMWKNTMQREKLRKMSSSLGLKGAWGYLQPSTNFEAAALKGHQPQTSCDWVDLDTPTKVLTSCF